MRTLTRQLSDAALPTLGRFIKQTKTARIFRRAQTVREVITGQRLQSLW